jgi:hypothetical protein
MDRLYSMLALDLARQRSAEADRHRLAALARANVPKRVGLVRRVVARTAVAIARAADEYAVRSELAPR